jgi:hypothetical protein
MTTSEHREMVEEAQALMEGGRHPWPMLLKALEVGDRSVAEAVAEAGSSRFSARKKIAAAAIKWTFPESPRGMERSPRRGARGVDPSDCGGAYQAKPEEYNQSEACSKALHRVECPQRTGSSTPIQIRLDAMFR